MRRFRGVTFLLFWLAPQFLFFHTIGAWEKGKKYSILTQGGTVISGARFISETEDSIFIEPPETAAPIALKKSSLILDPETQKSRLAVIHSGSVPAALPEFLSRSSAENPASLWPAGRFSVAAYIGASNGALGQLLPFGFSGILAYEQAIPFLKGWYMPVVRAETGYTSLTKQAISVRGFTTRGGLSWLIPAQSLGGNILIAATAGWAFLSLTDTTWSGKHEAFSGAGLLGYEKRFGSIGLFIESRFEYIYDPLKPLQTWGGAFGASYNFGGGW